MRPDYIDPQTRQRFRELVAALPTVDEWARELDEEYQHEYPTEPQPPEDGEPLCF